MSTRLPLGNLVVLLIAAVAAVVVFVLLNTAFGGPGSQLTSQGGSTYELTLRLANSGQLLPKSLVMVNGLRVGEVTTVHADTTGARVTFTVDKAYRPVRRGAWGQVGWRTAFGEAYLRLNRGRPDAPALPSGAMLAARQQVLPDDALQIFNPTTRTHLQGWMGTLGKALSPPGTADAMHDNITNMNRAVGDLRRLTLALRGQEDQIAGLVSNSRTIVDALAARQQSLRTVVSAGATTLSALRGRNQALEAGLAELPQLTAGARATLDELPPLLDQAGPVSRDATAAVQAMRPALAQMPGALRSATALAQQFPGLTKQTVPALKEAQPVTAGLKPAADWLVPALRNILPLAQWLQPRATAYATTFANIASATAHGDSDGKWLRLWLLLDADGTWGKDMTEHCGKRDDGPTGACYNPYPAPGSALDNQPYKPGSFERLLPAPVG